MATQNGPYTPDLTFRGYTSNEAEEYARRRGGYPPRMIDEVIEQHTSTGGTFGTILDLGCGPGSATRDLAPHFDHTIGMDPGTEMIRTATALGGQAKKGPIRFLVGGAEDCPGVADESVDLITAATAAHWFDMERFWPTANRVLKPGGTVAFFTIWRTWFVPTQTAEGAEAHRLLEELEQGTLGPYQTAGSWKVMNSYVDLQMPWSLPHPGSLPFPKDSYRRQVWNLDGKPEPDGSYACGERKMTLEHAENVVGTISAATRWRQQNPALAGTEDDVIIKAFRRIGEVLKASPQEKVTMVGPSVVVIVKKDAEVLG